jgi:hypothetical protein
MWAGMRKAGRWGGGLFTIAEFGRQQTLAESILDYLDQQSKNNVDALARNSRGRRCMPVTTARPP